MEVGMYYYCVTYHSRIHFWKHHIFNNTQEKRFAAPQVDKIATHARTLPACIFRVQDLLYMLWRVIAFMKPGKLKRCSVCCFFFAFVRLPLCVCALTQCSSDHRCNDNAQNHTTYNDHDFLLCGLNKWEEQSSKAACGKQKDTRQ